MRPLSIVALTLFALAGVACGGAGNVGEACETPGSADDCVGGAICVQNESSGAGDPADPTWDSYSCRELCDTQSDCEAGLECRGVTASALRACQPPRTL